MHSSDDPINLTVRHFQMLTAAADLGSFSRAAERLGISQPALSEGIRKIETELGCRVFDRTTRSLALTADGRRIVATARELVRDYRLGLEKIRSEGSEGRGSLSVAALPSIVSSVMPTALRRFAARFPDVDVAIHDVPHERATALVVDGLADIGLTIASPKRDQLRFHELGPDPFQVVVAKDHPLQAKDRIRWKDLAEYPFVAMTGLSSIRRVTDAAFVSAEISPKVRCEVEQIPSALALVESGYGVTALPSLAFAMFRARDVFVRPLIAPVRHRRIGLIALAHRRMSASSSYMAEILEKELKLVLTRLAKLH